MTSKSPHGVVVIIFDGRVSATQASINHRRLPVKVFLLAVGFFFFLQNVGYSTLSLERDGQNCEHFMNPRTLVLYYPIESMAIGSQLDAISEISLASCQ